MIFDHFILTKCFGSVTLHYIISLITTVIGHRELPPYFLPDIFWVVVQHYKLSTQWCSCKYNKIKVLVTLLTLVCIVGDIGQFLSV